eukprot:1693640-Rhodomonas_salina.1
MGAIGEAQTVSDIDSTRDARRQAATSTGGPPQAEVKGPLAVLRFDVRVLVPLRHHGAALCQYRTLPGPRRRVVRVLRLPSHLKTRNLVQ